MHASQIYQTIENMPKLVGIAKAEKSIFAVKKLNTVIKKSGACIITVALLIKEEINALKQKQINVKT